MKVSAPLVRVMTWVPDPIKMSTRPSWLNVPLLVQLPPTRRFPAVAFMTSVPLERVKFPGQVRSLLGMATVDAPAWRVTFMGTPTPTFVPEAHSFPTVTPAA